MEVKAVMAIAFTENSKRLVFDILDYEFPAVSKSDYDYDSNWLKISMDYSDRSFSFQEEVCCLLSFEFRELIGAIDGILSGRETGYISDFMEPYLSFALTKAEDTYAVMIKFIYDGSAWNDIVSGNEPAGIDRPQRAMQGFIRKIPLSQGGEIMPYRIMKKELIAL